MKNKKLDIIYQDKFIIVINKPAGLLTIATDRERFNTLYEEVSSYERQKHKANKVFIVHRLDKDTSGVVIFAKNKKTKDLFQNNWEKYAKTRKYYAIVTGILKDKSGTIKSYLKDNASYVTYSTQNNKDGKLAITNYKVISSKKNMSFLEITLKTGRKNQIRVHMQDLGHSILGDKKYGSKINPLKRLALHASMLEIIHPETEELMVFEAKLPTEFTRYI